MFHGKGSNSLGQEQTRHDIDDFWHPNDMSSHKYDETTAIYIE